MRAMSSPRTRTSVTGRRTQVFEGIDSSNEESCVIKVLKPVAKKKIKREIKILRNLAGGPNVIRLMDIVHDPPSRSNSLIMEYVENTEWKEMFGTLTEMEIKFYLFQLLRVSSARLRFSPSARLNVHVTRHIRVGPGLRSFTWDHSPGCQAGKHHVRPRASQGM